MEENTNIIQVDSVVNPIANILNDDDLTSVTIIEEKFNHINQEKG